MSNIPYHRYPSKYWTINPSNAIIRSQFVRDKTFPTAAQIRDNLGSIMAEVFFSTLTPEVRDCLGISKPLEGPQGSLWNSPSSQLLGENKLTKVPSLRIVQSFTHNAIMEMGLQFEADQEERNKKIVAEAVAKKEQEMQQLMEIKLREMREKTKCEFFELYSLRMKEVFLKLKAEYDEMLSEKEKLIRQQLEEEKEFAIRTMKESLECEVANLTKKLNDEFEIKLKFVRDWDANDLYENYKTRMNYYLKKWEKAFNDAKITSNEELNEALARANVNNFNLTMNAIEMERNNFHFTLTVILKYFKDRLETLNKELNELKDYVERMNLDNVAFLERKAWECVLKDVLLQFQKFINFVLQEIPGQANYLLSLAEIVKTRKECLKKVFDDHVVHIPSPQECLSRNWGEVLIEPDDPIEDPYKLMADSPVCLNTIIKEETPEELTQSLLSLAKESKPGLEDWAKILVNWVTARLQGIDQNNLPALPRGAISEDGSTDSDLRNYLSNLFEKATQMQEREKRINAIEILRKEVDKAKKAMPRDLKIVGADDPKDLIKEGFQARRLESVIDILVRHPELREVIIKP